MDMIEKPLPIEAMLRGTHYFEVASAKVGASFGVWVTLPAEYEKDPGRYFPAVFTPDANGTVGTMAAVRGLAGDVINPIAPVVHVAVGYTAQDVADYIAIRARDLLPPGEPLLPGTEQSMTQMVKMGLMTEATAALYFHHLQNPAGDKYADFLETELFPAIAQRFRVAGDHGFFGYSYGGTFALYMAMRRSPLFKRCGAGSPGVLADVASVFRQWRAHAEAGADFTGRRLHVTVAALEITAPSYYQSHIGAGVAQLLTFAGQRPLTGLRFTSRLIEHESHATGVAASWFDYLRACYGTRHR